MRVRAGQEHRNLQNKNGQLFVKVGDEGCHYLLYVEDVSTTNQSGVDSQKLKGKVVRSYENVEDHSRCMGSLCEKFIAHCPDDAESFYLRPLNYPTMQ